MYSLLIYDLSLLTLFTFWSIREHGVCMCVCVYVYLWMYICIYKSSYIYFLSSLYLFCNTLLHDMLDMLLELSDQPLLQQVFRGQDANTEKDYFTQEHLYKSPILSHTDWLTAQDVKSSGFFGMLRILDEALFELFALVALVPHPLWAGLKSFWIHVELN